MENETKYVLYTKAVSRNRGNPEQFIYIPDRQEFDTAEEAKEACERFKVAFPDKDNVAWFREESGDELRKWRRWSGGLK